MFKVIGFDNKEHVFNYSKHNKRKYDTNKSSLHIKARELIKELFSQYSVYEEITLPGSKRAVKQSLLFADFYIPDLALVVEVHGQQHYEYSSFFHKSVLHFYQCKKRDKDKIEWCENNGIEVIELPYNRKKEWKEILQKVRPIQ